MSRLVVSRLGIRMGVKALVIPLHRWVFVNPTFTIRKPLVKPLKSPLPNRSRPSPSSDTNGMAILSDAKAPGVLKRQLASRCLCSAACRPKYTDKWRAIDIPRFLFQVLESDIGIQWIRYYSIALKLEVYIAPSIMALQPPHAPPEWNHTAREIGRLVLNAIDAYKSTLDQVGSLQAHDCNFDSVFVALAKAQTAFDSVVEPLAFYQNAAELKEIRDASSEAETVARDFGIEKKMRIDVFNAKVSAEENIKRSGQWENLSSEEQRLVDKMVLDGKRAGLALPSGKRDQLTVLQKELNQACLEFQKNFNEENGRIFFTEDELQGVAPDVLSGYPSHIDGGHRLYEVTFKGPDVSPILAYAQNSETRRRIQEAQESRLAINVPVLERVLHLRRQISKLLGYDSWADYVTEDRMIKTGKAVQDFLDDLEKKVLPIGMKELESMLSIKKEDCEARNIPFDGRFYLWDYDYYGRKDSERRLEIDSALIKEHFPVPFVVSAVLDMYQSLFGVRFEERKDASTWHPDVQSYSVWRKDATDASGFIGYTYLDLFPRPGKYSHIAVWPLIPGYKRPDGQRNYPVNVMLANLSQPAADRPGLMRHHDVVQFFHEMGHIFHDLLSKTKFGRFHGTGGALDFVEAPSQMLENWCWEPKVLEKISRHYLTGAPLPSEMANRLVKNRQMNVGIHQLIQIFFSKFDLKIHLDPAPQDYTELWCKIRRETSLRDHITNSPGQTALPHLATGYDVGMYGYTYSRVFATDMYDTIFKADPLDPSRAKRYEEKVLSPGGSKDEIEILTDFLGRSPNAKAFLQRLLGGNS